MYYTGEHLYNIVKTNLDKIPHDIKGIIAIPRGGLFPGFIIAEHLNIPITTVDKFLENRQTCWFNESTFIKFNQINDGKLLVIDDSTDTGKSLAQTKEKLKDIQGYQFIYCVIHSSYYDNNLIVLDEDKTPGRIYEFNIFRVLPKGVITDFDGVLCKNPSYGLDLNEEKYINFILNTPPYLHVPYIDVILTSRLEKYRGYVEEWLHKNNITYNKLIMLPFDNVQEKIAEMQNGTWNEAVWKCNEYVSICQEQNLRKALVESNRDISLFIRNRVRNSIVYCTDTSELMY